MQISACKGQYQIAFLILLLNSWVDIIIILCYQFLLFCSFIKMPLLQDVARPYLLQQWSGKDLDQVGKAKVRITWWLWALFIQNFNNWWNKTIHNLYFNNIRTSMEKCHLGRGCTDPELFWTTRFQERSRDTRPLTGPSPACLQFIRVHSRCWVLRRLPREQWVSVQITNFD